MRKDINFESWTPGEKKEWLKSVKPNWSLARHTPAQINRIFENYKDMIEIFIEEELAVTREIIVNGITRKVFIRDVESVKLTGAVGTATFVWDMSTHDLPLLKLQGTNKPTGQKLIDARRFAKKFIEAYMNAEFENKYAVYASSEMLDKETDHDEEDDDIRHDMGYWRTGVHTSWR